MNLGTIAENGRSRRRGRAKALAVLLACVPVFFVAYFWLRTPEPARRSGRVAFVGPLRKNPPVRRPPAADVPFTLVLIVLGISVLGLFLVIRQPRRPESDRTETDRTEAGEERQWREPGPERRSIPEVPPTLFVKQGAWKVVAASVVGTSHARTPVPCQDAAFCRILGGTTLIAAVADGAGSARHSDQGSKLAVKKAVDAVVDALAGAPRAARNGTVLTDQQWHHVLQAAMYVALGHIEVAAALRGVPSRELATTLLLFAATPNFVVAAQIGDGAIVVEDIKGRFHAITTPQNGEYANMATFLVTPNAFKSMQHEVWRGVYKGIAAFTDGLQRLALSMPQGDPHAPFFRPLFEYAEQAEDGPEAIREIDAFLRSGKVTQRSDDDLTLMLARMTV